MIFVPNDLDDFIDDISITGESDLFSSYLYLLSTPEQGEYNALPCCCLIEYWFGLEVFIFKNVANSGIIESIRDQPLPYTLTPHVR